MPWEGTGYPCHVSLSLRVPALRGGGLVLGYRCPARCRHCLYACGPHREPARGDPEALLDLLAERAPGASFHIGGGEPFLDRELLLRAVEGLRRRRLTLEYVETNASWVRNAAQARLVLEDLAQAGLSCVLVSFSPFHAEFVPYGRALALAEVAGQVLPGGAFVWLPQFLGDLRQLSAERPIDLDALLDERGADYARQLAARYGLVPGGRAGRFLYAWEQRLPWRQLAARAPCRARLRDTSHFHVDLRGRYVPGLCAGLELPLELVPGSVDLAPYPALRALVGSGLAGLVELARNEAGFEPLECYASPCDLCGHARLALFPLGFAELGPAGFYAERSGMRFGGEGVTAVEP